jgi:RHS repeat-associated protein
MVMKSSSPGGVISKSEFDGVGRTLKSYITDGGGDSGYSDADDVTSDNVLSQMEYTYDANSNTTLTVSRERFHDETDTGALGTPTTGVNARVSYVANYYDIGNRLTDVVDVGTNGGSAYTRPGSVPSRSDTVLITSYGYNSVGYVESVTDPRGIINKAFFDLAGRTTKTIENYVNGVVSDSDDKTVEYTYHANNQMKTLKAYLTSSTSESTEWILGTTSPVASNDIVLEMRYPDASTGASSSSEKDQYTYNVQGQIKTFTDRNGSVHTYEYDILGRLVSDAVTTHGSGVDGAVRRIETAYDTQGNAYLFTSYDAASGGNIVNQVQREFNGLGQLTTEWQAVGGAVNTSSSPKVQYAYSFTTSGSMNHSRLTTITYPNGRVITFNYASGLNDNISRLTSITDGATTLESYEYLGTGTVVKRGHAQPGVDLTFIKLSGESNGDAGDPYIGLDRFGRVVDQRWTTSGGTTKDRFQYGYDRDSNRLYKENLVDSTKSELYGYDGLNQIVSFDRGTLNGTKDGISGSPSRTQDWDFDGLGNWESLTTDGGSAQTRTHNKQNELTAASGQTSPTYDNNGNQTKDFADRRFKFDAWNRLVEVQPPGGGSAIRVYEYDALGRRIQETASGTTTDFYYSASWQVLEERVSGNAKVSYVWSPVYIDAMIARDRDTDSNGSLDERLYAMHDANFNVTGLVNTSGTVVERPMYDAFGSPTFYDGSYSSIANSAYGWNYLHQGLRWDGTIGKVWNRRRDYDPEQGRFIEIDPIIFSGGDVDLYRYVGNSPPNLADPSGLSSKFWKANMDVLRKYGFNPHGDPMRLGGDWDTILRKIAELIEKEPNKYRICGHLQTILLALEVSLSVRMGRIDTDLGHPMQTWREQQLHKSLRDFIKEYCGGYMGTSETPKVPTPKGATLPSGWRDLIRAMIGKVGIFLAPVPSEGTVLGPHPIEAPAPPPPVVPMIPPDPSRNRPVRPTMPEQRPSRPQNPARPARPPAPSPDWFDLPKIPRPKFGPWLPCIPDALLPGPGSGSTWA